MFILVNLLSELSDKELRGCFIIPELEKCFN